MSKIPVAPISRAVSSARPNETILDPKLACSVDPPGGWMEVVPADESLHSTSKCLSPAPAQELGACQVRVSFASPGVTCTFRGGSWVCACAGATVNSDSAPSSSARAGRRPERRARRRPVRGSDLRGEPVGGAGLRAPAKRRAHFMPLAAGRLYTREAGAGVKKASIHVPAWSGGGRRTRHRSLEFRRGTLQINVPGGDPAVRPRLRTAAPGAGPAAPRRAAPAAARRAPPGVCRDRPPPGWRPQAPGSVDGAASASSHTGDDTRTGVIAHFRITA